MIDHTSCFPLCCRKLKRFGNASGLLAGLTLFCLSPSISPAAHLGPAQVALDWVSHQGSAGTDVPESITVDSDGNVLIAGWTRGDLSGAPVGLVDGFVSKYDAAGSLQWTRQIDSGAADFVHGISLDKQGHFYVAGYSNRVLDSPLNFRGDSFVKKYNANGELIWTRKQHINNQTAGIDVSADALGDVFTVGFSTADINTSQRANAFVSKYDDAGNLAWSLDLSIDQWAQAQGVVADNLGNAYVTGYSHGNLAALNGGWSDAFLHKYDSAGQLLWNRKIGTDTIDSGEDVAIDGLGNVYITGYTLGSLAAPIPGVGYHRVDAFVSKFDPEGNNLWTRQIGSAGRDYSESITADAAGNVYIAGYTEGVLGEDSQGDTDGFVLKLNSSGELLWVQQVGSSAGDWGYDIANGGQGKLYFTGTTAGDFGGPKRGDALDSDIFIARFNLAVPEPSTLHCLVLLLAASFLPRRARHAV